MVLKLVLGDTGCHVHLVNEGGSSILAKVIEYVVGNIKRQKGTTSPSVLHCTIVCRRPSLSYNNIIVITN